MFDHHISASCFFCSLLARSDTIDLLFMFDIILYTSLVRTRSRECSCVFFRMVRSSVRSPLPVDRVSLLIPPIQLAPGWPFVISYHYVGELWFFSFSLIWPDLSTCFLLTSLLQLEYYSPHYILSILVLYIWCSNYMVKEAIGQAFGRPRLWGGDWLGTHLTLLF